MARLGGHFVLSDEGAAVLLSEQRNEERLAVVQEEIKGATSSGPEPTFLSPTFPPFRGEGGAQRRMRVRPAEAFARRARLFLSRQAVAVDALNPTIPAAGTSAASFVAAEAAPTERI